MVETPLDNIAVMVARLRMWSATRKASRETDLKAVADRLPPKKVLSNGEVRLIAPIHMEWTSKFRKRLERLVRKHGTRTYAGDIIPKENLHELLAELRVFEADLERAVELFLRELPSYVRQWNEANEEWIEILSRTTVTPETVRGLFGFRYTIFKPAPIEGAETSIDEMLQSIGESVATEVATLIGPVWKSSIKGRSQLQARSLNVFHQVATKLRTFSGIDPVLAPAAQMLDETLSSLGGGTVSGSDFIRVERAALVLSNRDTILEYGKASDDDAMSPSSHTATAVAVAKPVPTVKAVPRPAAVGIGLTRELPLVSPTPRNVPWELDIANLGF